MSDYKRTIGGAVIKAPVDDDSGVAPMDISPAFPPSSKSTKSKTPPTNNFFNQKKDRTITFSPSPMDISPAQPQKSKTPSWKSAKNASSNSWKSPQSFTKKIPTISAQEFISHYDTIYEGFKERIDKEYIRAIDEVFKIVIKPTLSFLLPNFFLFSKKIHKTCKNNFEDLEHIRFQEEKDLREYLKHHKGMTIPFNKNFDLLENLIRFRNHWYAYYVAYNECYDAMYQLKQKLNMVDMRLSPRKLDINILYDIYNTFYKIHDYRDSVGEPPWIHPLYESKQISDVEKTYYTQLKSRLEVFDKKYRTFVDSTFSLKIQRIRGVLKDHEEQQQKLFEQETKKRQEAEMLWRQQQETHRKLYEQQKREQEEIQTRRRYVENLARQQQAYMQKMQEEHSKMQEEFLKRQRKLYEEQQKARQKEEYEREQKRRQQREEEEEMRKKRDQQKRQRQPIPVKSVFDPYHILGVSTTDDYATIDKKYKKLVLKMHPDKIMSTQKRPPTNSNTAIFQDLEKARDFFKKKFGVA
jgi:hypothetical protein